MLPATVYALRMQQQTIDRQRARIGYASGRRFLDPPEVATRHHVRPEGHLERHFRQAHPGGVQALDHRQGRPFFHLDTIFFECFAKTRRQSEYIKAGEREDQFLYCACFEKHLQGNTTAPANEGKVPLTGGEKSLNEGDGNPGEVDTTNSQGSSAWDSVSKLSMVTSFPKS